MVEIKPVSLNKTLFQLPDLPKGIEHYLYVLTEIGRERSKINEFPEDRLTGASIVDFLRDYYNTNPEYYHQMNFHDWQWKMQREEDIGSGKTAVVQTNSKDEISKIYYGQTKFVRERDESQTPPEGGKKPANETSPPEPTSFGDNVRGWVHGLRRASNNSSESGEKKG